MNTFLPAGSVPAARLPHVTRHAVNRLAVATCLLSLWSYAAHSLAADDTRTLTLPTAIERTLAQHPDLQVFPLRTKKLQGDAQTDALRPAMEIGLEVENFAGSGDFRDTQSLDTTLALSSVLELGQKRAARIATANARLAQLQAEQAAAMLDASGEAARRFLDALLAQEHLHLAREAEQLARNTTHAVQQRAAAGAGSDADVLRAQAAEAQAALVSSKASSDARAARVSLAATWGDTDADFLRVEGDLLAVGSQEPLSTLSQRIQNNPITLALASETRVKAAELRLAQANTRRDIQWSAGVRHFNDSNDTALVASVSMPLFAERRGAGAVMAAQADNDTATLAQNNALKRATVQLTVLHGQRQRAITAVHGLQERVIPLLQQALHATRTAFVNGNATYQDWSMAKQELLSAQQLLLDTAADAQRLRIDMEQLTAEPVLSQPPASQP